jgi:hypothetical protein
MPQTVEQVEISIQRALAAVAQQVAQMADTIRQLSSQVNEITNAKSDAKPESGEKK